MTHAQKPELDGSGLSLAVVVSRFNQHVTGRLLEGALTAVERCGGSPPDVFWVPGSFEIPLIAQRLARSGRYHALVCLGAVIRHDTDHYEHVAREAASGIQRVALDTGVPCIFGVLTTDSEEQALARAGGRHGNKGDEAVESAIEMAVLLRDLSSD